MELFSAPFLALVGCWALNAVWPLVSQSGLRTYPPLVFTEAAFVLGFLFLLPELIRRREWKTFLSPKAACHFLAIAIFYGTPCLLYIAALSYTTPSSAGVVAEIEVLYSMVLSAWLLRESIGWRQAAASAMVVLGTGLILAHDSGTSRWKGDMMIAASAWMYQVSHILVKRLPAEVSPTAITGGRLFYQSAVFVIPVCGWALLRPTHAAWAWSWPGIGCAFVEGAGVIGVAGVFWYAAIRKIDLAKCTAFILSYPALTMLLSWLLGREAISAAQISGLAVTLAGAAWLSWLMIPTGAPSRLELSADAARMTP
ncbi:MAG: DMT family transporter [Elusimicrobia bacterium]|nr:DMT family transporter [Elusimicrobiota bacterium]MDE2314095.1 DMT family transporter [Elusimicrobiota bacterium]